MLTTGAGLALGYAPSWLGLAQAAAGDLAGARATLEAAVSTGIDWGLNLASTTALLADLLRCAGDPAGGEARAGEALAIAERIGHQITIAAAKEILGRLAAGRAEWARAETLLHEALALRVEHELLMWVPQTFDALAEIAAGLGSHKEAARILGAGQRAYDDLGLVRWAPTTASIAQLEQELREALGDEAYEHALREGGDLTAADAIIWIRGARGERKRPARGWESLTPTELRVVALVAEGLTNPQIGTQMFISRATVKAHLNHIFGKLDVTNRSELTAEATRRSLTR